MNQRTYRELVVRLAEHLVDSTQVSFRNLAEMSRANRRVRNVFVFYALTDERNMEMFFQLESKDYFYSQLRNQLVHSLLLLKEDNDPDVVQFGEYYLSRYFQDFSEQSRASFVDRQPSRNKYDVSSEMAKLVQTLVYRYKRQQEDTPEFRMKLEERRKRVQILI